MITRRERRIMAAAAALALGIPLGAAAWVRARTAALADRLGELGGVPARIGGIDAGLTGAIRLSDVALGDLVAADAIEASVAMGSLLDGRLRADEVVVEAPRVAVRVDASGDSDLARLARRLIGHRGAGGSRRGGGVRRIVIAEGTLAARIAGLGELSAAGVELIPDATGVRMVTGRVALHGKLPAAAGLELQLDVAFARSAADLSLSTMRFGRMLAVGGTGTVRAGATEVALREAAVGRLAPSGALELRASIDDGGAARPLAIEIRHPSALAAELAGAPGAATDELAITLRGDRVPLAALAALAPRGLDLGSARATGTLAIRRRAHQLDLAADGRIDGLVVAHRAFAAEPVPLSAGLVADVAIAPDAIAVTRGELTLGAAHVAATGWVRRTAPASGQLDVELASAPCADLLASLPGELRGALDGLALTGSLGARARLAVDLAAPTGDGATLTSALSGRCDVVAEPPLADVTTLAAPGEQQLADGSRARVGSGERDHVELRRLPPYVARAFVSAEDAQFYKHHGFDEVQIARSLEIDLRERRLARGGSTISQQLVKNAFLSQRRSFDRKLQEAILTWRLEARVDKRHILERYLDVIELGPHVFGLTAAARYWFATAPHKLTVRQAAFLAALTSQPSSMSRRVRRAGGLDPDSAERVAIILLAMHRDGAIGAEAYEAAKQSSLHLAPSALSE